MVMDVGPVTPKFGWWSVLDGALLQLFSCSKPQTASERWLRVEKRAAKVGKGLVKNVKGKKLVSQHWLEAIDPLHRYGHNLRFYFLKWCLSATRDPFFYWLDFGEGKELDLEECPREKLQDERIRYLGPREREQYEVVVEDGKLQYKLSGELVNSTKGDKWIFVMSTGGVLYVGKKEKGALQHSSFMAGGAITSAGRLRSKDGIIKHIEAHSGHYRPTRENFNQLVTILESRGADLTTAKIQYSSKEMTTAKSLKIDQMYEAISKWNQDKSPTSSPTMPSRDSTCPSDYDGVCSTSGHDTDKRSTCSWHHRKNERGSQGCLCTQGSGEGFEVCWLDEGNENNHVDSDGEGGHDIFRRECRKNEENGANCGNVCPEKNSVTDRMTRSINTDQCQEGKDNENLQRLEKEKLREVT